MKERRRNNKGQFGIEHGQRHTKLYGVWSTMKSRCNNPNNKSFKRYGDKGIKVCDEWVTSFKSFYDWALTAGYKDGLTIDRIDNSKGYNPDNCRWVTSSEQNRNYSRNHLITYNGRTQCLTDWADELGINRATLLMRLKRGKTVEQAFSKNDGRVKRWKATILSNYST